MKNKGFSMVELIIVIAVMAILAGFLAPSLVRYINKSRLSTDIDTASNLAKAISAAAVSENARDSAVDHNTPQNIKDMDGQAFKDEVSAIMPVDEIVGKAQKDVNGDPLDQNFYYTLDPAKNKVEVYYGGTTDDYKVYPVTGSKLLEQN